MPGILVPLMLIMLYQQAQTQRKIHWGKRLCDQVRPFLVGEKGDVYKVSGNGCSKHGYPYHWPRGIETYIYLSIVVNAG